MPSRATPPAPAPASRILLVRLSAIGDVVNVLPALALLRAALPAAYLAFLVEDRAAPVVTGHPLLDETIVFPRRRWRGWLADPRRWPELAREVAAHRRRLRGEGFDVVLDFQGNLKGAVQAFATGAPRRIGFAAGHDREGSHRFATEHVVPPADRPHRVDKFASLVAPLGAVGAERRYVLPTSQASRQRIDAFLERVGEGKGPHRFAILHPGTSDRGAAKRWPAERYGELARRARERFARRSIVTWGPGEEALAREVCAAAPEATVFGPHTESILDLAELATRSAVFVSADTGPMHLAVAAGARCVALFGPKDPAVYGPYGAGHRVVRAPGGPGPRAMAGIAVDAALEAVAEILGAPEGAAPAGSR